METLINALQNLPGSQPVGGNPASSPISAQLQASISQLLDDLPDIQQMTTPKGVAQALNASGVFLEAKLLAGLNPMQAPDMKANLMRLIGQILPGLPEKRAPCPTRFAMHWARWAWSPRGLSQAAFRCPHARSAAVSRKTIWNCC